MRRRIPAIAIGAVSVLSWGASEGAAQNPQPTVQLRRVHVEPAGASSSIVIEADGALPEPASDTAEGPPRVFLDLPGVVPGIAVGAGAGDQRIRRTRVALHSSSPTITRVVIDLVRRLAYRIDATARAQGRLIVFVDGGPAESVARPSAPPAPQPAAASSGRSPRAAARSAEMYPAQVSVLVERLQTLRPVLVSIDHRDDISESVLTAAGADFEAVGQMLAALKPPEPGKAAHGMLLRACTFGTQAARIRAAALRRADPAAGWNAASAAAGALMMLDQAAAALAQPAGAGK